MLDPILSLSELVSGDSDSYIRQNERNLVSARLHGPELKQTAVVAADPTALTSVLKGDLFMVTSTPGTTFDGTMWNGVLANSLVVALGDAPTSALGWALIPPVRGMTVMNAGSDNTTQVYRSTGWGSVADIPGVSHYHMEDNATATTIATQSVAVKAAGTTVSGSSTSGFTNTTTNRATYDGTVTRHFAVAAVASLEGGNNKVLEVWIYKNGVAVTGGSSHITSNSSGKGENVSVQTIVEMSATDYLEAWVANDTDTTDVTVTHLNMIIHSV